MAITLEIDLSELNDFYDDIEEIEPYISEEIKKAMDRALIVLQDATASRVPVNTGALRGSITTQQFGQPLGTLQGEVLTPSQYGLAVEHGRKAGKQPPPAAILGWVQRKLNLRGQEAESAAFLIARAIGRRGTKGAFMFRDGFKATSAEITGFFETIPDKIVARLAMS